MLQLAGLIWGGKAVSDEELSVAIQKARLRLQAVTGRDHGYSLVEWHNSLLDDPEYYYLCGSQHPATTIHADILSMCDDPRRERIVRQMRIREGSG